MNFVRGVDPKRAMKIGIITWDNLGPNNFLIQKKYPVPVYGREDEILFPKFYIFAAMVEKWNPISLIPIF